MCVCGGGYVHVSAGALRRGSSLETEVAMSHLSCVLGTELPLEEQYALLTSEPLPQLHLGS